MKVSEVALAGGLLALSLSVQAVPVTQSFVARSIDYDFFETEDYTFSLTYDPDTILGAVTHTADDPFSKTRYFAVDGAVSKGGQTANVDSVLVQMNLNSWFDRWSFSVVYTIDPAPFNDTGSYVEDDDQNDGLTFVNRNGTASNADLNEIRFGFGVNRYSPNWDKLPTDASGLPILPGDLDFLQYAEFASVQASFFGIPNHGSLFKVLGESPADVTHTGTVSGTGNQGTGTPSPATVPEAATPWLMVIGLLGAVAARTAIS